MTMRTQIEVGNACSLACRPLSRNVVRIVISLFFSIVWTSVYAGKPVVEFVEFEQGASGWTANVTVRHGDTGWDHYADAWRIVDPDNKVIGTRTLYHPHESEQPFTRSLSGVAIPSSISAVEVQAHDKVHGWGAGVRVDLTQAEGAKFRVRRSD